MILLEILLGIYLVFGFIYAVYILFVGTDRWYAFPINVLGGPIVVLYILYVEFTNKRMPLSE